MKPRIVCDTHVLVSHFVLPNRNPSKVLQLVIAGKAELVLSEAILEELEDVLARKLYYSREDAREAAGSFRTIARVIHPIHAVDRIREDEDDNRILECALSAEADVLVSGDRKHLLPLREFRGIRIMSPFEFVKEFLA